MTPEERAKKCVDESSPGRGWRKELVPSDLTERIAAAIRESERAAVERCVQSVRDYADGIECGMDADGRSPELVASFETALDIANMLEGKQ